MLQILACVMLAISVKYKVKKQMLLTIVLIRKRIQDVLSILFLHIGRKYLRICF